ncbi:MAG: transporter, partial [Flavobacterium sp.]
MFRSKPIAVLFVLLSSAMLHAQFTDVINSNRPGESMAAFSVGKTVIQAESGIYYQKEQHDVLDYKAAGLGLDLDLRYGAFLEQLEFIMNLQYQRDKFEAPIGDRTRSGIRQMILGAKYLVYDPNKNYEKKPNLYSWKANHSFSWHEFIPAVGVYGGFNLNVFNNPFSPPDEEKFSPKAMVMTQNQFGKWVFVTNIIADKIISKYMSFGYILTLTRGFNERWSGFIENQGIKGDYYSDAIFRGGAAYLLKENFQIDASVGANLKSTPSLFNVGVGIAWRFDD